MHNKNIIHRDIKPENIMYCNKKSNHIKLIDFGETIRLKEHEKSKEIGGTVFS